MRTFHCQLHQSFLATPETETYNVIQDHSGQAGTELESRNHLGGVDIVANDTILVLLAEITMVAVELDLVKAQGAVGKGLEQDDLLVNAVSTVDSVGVDDGSDGLHVGVLGRLGRGGEGSVAGAGRHVDGLKME